REEGGAGTGDGGGAGHGLRGGRDQSAGAAAPAADGGGRERARPADDVRERGPARAGAGAGAGRPAAVDRRHDGASGAMSDPRRGAGDRWLAGEPVDGVRFGHHEAVVVTAGPWAGRVGRVALLLTLGDDPLYLVQ